MGSMLNASFRSNLALKKIYISTSLINIVIKISISRPKIRFLRGPAPKKRPMISGSNIESADFHLPSRGYQILFKNEFLS